MPSATATKPSNVENSNNNDAEQQTPTTPTAPAPQVSLQDQSDKLEAEIMMAEMDVDTLTSSIARIDDTKPAAKVIKENASKRLASLTEVLTKKREQFAAISTRLANAAVFDPFFAAVGELPIPSDLQKIEVKLPGSLQIADIKAKVASARLTLAVLEPIEAAAELHLKTLPREAWDNMPALHLAVSESGSSVSVKFATGRAKSSSDATPGQGRGKAATYRVISTPEDRGDGEAYDGLGAAGDMFGADTPNADQKAYAEKVEPVRFAKYVETRHASGGRVSPFNALRALGWGIEKVGE